ncbi:response regulator [Haladaptatus halobius]|uniref:response regulator n=1 Tax=Haladaptatus halobius TaxID=2884875 RepID=UPI001D0ABDC5|nr:response regulator [Haladaptatus halobius]
MSDSPSIVVLHVDDDEDLLDLTATFLERESEQLQLRTASSATDAREEVRKGGIDCAVCDYELGDANGLDLLETVRELHPELPFILFTSVSSEALASRAVSAGVTDYFQKDVSSDQCAVLANRIEKAVHSYRTDDALREREELYRTVVEGSHDVI